MQIDFVEPWVAVGDQQNFLEEELRRELTADNALAGSSLKAIGRRIDCDDVLFALDSEVDKAELVVIHLTWSGKSESTLWPRTKLYPDAESFINQMLLDAQEYC